MGAGRRSRREVWMAGSPRFAGLHHIAAVVDLRDNAIGLVLKVEGSCSARPFGRRIATGLIGQNIAVPVGVLAGDDDAGLVGVSPVDTAGSIATTIRTKSGIFRWTGQRVSSISARDQRAPGMMRSGNHSGAPTLIRHARESTWRLIAVKLRQTGS